jgi:glycosyltransferase involved in cell wall biosynthesis
MKILHVVHTYHPSKGGTQLLFKEISERLVKNYGDEVIVCTTDSFYGPEKKFYKPIGIPGENINGVIVKRFSFFRFHLEIIRKLNKVINLLGIKTPESFNRYVHGPLSPAMEKFISDFDGDVICASAYNYLFMTYPLNAKSNKPFVFMGAVHFKEDTSFNPIGPRLLKSIKNSAFYIANTVFEKGRLTGMGVIADKIKVVGCGVDPDAFVSKISSDDFRRKYSIGKGQIVGYVGRHQPSKGIALLIDAMAHLWKKGQPYQLIIAGSPTNYTEVLKQKISMLESFSPNIHFISNFSDEEKVDIFHNLDVFVSVSTEESFGIVYLEAWACKKPVIGANIGAIRSVIDDGTDGYLVDPTNALQLAGKIDQLCSDENERKRMGDNGYDKVVKNYTWDIITSKYRKIYEAAASTQSSKTTVLKNSGISNRIKV